MRIHSAAILGAALLLAGCASKDMVVVLPAADGHIGGVVVEACNKKVVLDTAYAEEFSDCHAGTVTADGVDKGFHDVLAALPKTPVPFTFLFEHDSAEETPDIKKQFADVADVIFARLQPSEIVITGHTDTSGTPEYNDGLSLRRAELIKSLFSASDVQQRLRDRHVTITTAGRGYRDAIITKGVSCKDTPEEKSCKAARNVEITVQ